MWWDTLKHLKFYQILWIHYYLWLLHFCWVHGEPLPMNNHLQRFNILNRNSFIHCTIHKSKPTKLHCNWPKEILQSTNSDPSFKCFHHTCTCTAKPNKIHTLYVDRNTEEFWPNDWFDYDILIKFQVPSCGICYLKPLDPHHLPLLLQKPHSVQARCRSWCQSDPCLPYSGWQ